MLHKKQVRMQYPKTTLLKKLNERIMKWPPEKPAAWNVDLTKYLRGCDEIAGMFKVYIN